MPFYSNKNINRNDYSDLTHLYCRLII
jgi:hypothetical protein